MSVQPETWLTKVEQIAAEVCRREGCYLYDLEFLGTGNGRTLRVYVDKDGGSGIEDCSNVSKGLNEVLDEGETVPGGHYNLEVSTPGVDRHLRTPWHFEKVVGRRIQVRLGQPLETLGVTEAKWKPTRNLEQVLVSADGEAATFELDGVPVRVPYDVIEKAKVVFEVKQALKKKK